jgi:hypothetical protein
MIVTFLSHAQSELTDAVAYYEGELSGLGHRFWDELDQHIAWIERNHDVPRLRPGGYRRVNLKIFPYYGTVLQCGFEFPIRSKSFRQSTRTNKRGASDY